MLRLAAVLLIAIAAPAGAQDAERGAWLSLGVGPSAPGDDTGPSGSFGIYKDGVVVGGRFAIPVTDFVFDSDRVDGAVDTVSDIAALVGVRQASRWVTLTAASGVALVRYEQLRAEGEFGRLTRVRDITIGLPIQLEAVVTPFAPLGVGVRVVGDVNGAASFGAVHGALYLGIF